MTTFTKRATLMFSNYELTSALTTLKNGGLILYPTDSLWSIGCDATNISAVKKLLELTKTANRVEILVDSLSMLKKHVTHVHPRIETLLVYHTRPLSIKFKKPKGIADILCGQTPTMDFRVCQDEFCNELINELGNPIASCFASFDDQYLPTTFGAISSEVIQAVDYVSRYRQDDKIPDQLSVMIAMDDSNELLFLRD